MGKRNKKSDGDDEDLDGRDPEAVLVSLEEETGAAEAEGVELCKQLVAQKAKGKVLKLMSQQHLVDTIIPVVCSLKAVLERYKSPLQVAAITLSPLYSKCLY